MILLLVEVEAERVLCAPFQQDKFERFIGRLGDSTDFVRLVLSEIINFEGSSDAQILEKALFELDEEPKCIEPQDDSQEFSVESYMQDKELRKSACMLRFLQSVAVKYNQVLSYQLNRSCQNESNYSTLFLLFSQKILESFSAILRKYTTSCKSSSLMLITYELINLLAILLRGHRAVGSVHIFTENLLRGDSCPGKAEANGKGGIMCTLLEIVESAQDHDLGGDQKVLLDVLTFLRRLMKFQDFENVSISPGLGPQAAVGLELFRKYFSHEAKHSSSPNQGLIPTICKSNFTRDAPRSQLSDAKRKLIKCIFIAMSEIKQNSANSGIDLYFLEIWKDTMDTVVLPGLSGPRAPMIRPSQLTKTVQILNLMLNYAA